MEAPNATLVISNEEDFCNDIWQYRNNFTEEQWSETIKGFAGTLNNAYRFINQELYNKNGDEVCFPDDELYVIGDIINMLLAIDIKKK